MENKSLFKAGANADVEAGKFGVAGGCNDERFRGGGSSRDRRRDRDARSACSYTCILFREPCLAQRGGYCKKSLTETAAVVTHCVFLLPLGGSSRRNMQGEEYRSALGLHKIVSQPFHGLVQYYYNLIYDSRSKTLL